MSRAGEMPECPFSGTPMNRCCRKLILALCAILSLAAANAGAQPVPPRGPGPYAVGCSNVAQDFTRVPAGDSAQDYWEGNPAGSTARYITDLLADPAHTLVVNLAIPNDGGLYGQYANQSFPYVFLVCYPTSAANPYPDYPLPTGDVVPHMQQGAEQPVFADDAARYPVLLFSHGLTGSPLSGDYIDAVRVFASWGYVVVAPFHGDLRFADVKLESLSDYFYAIVKIKDFVAMQSVRPLSLSLGLDAVLGSAQLAAQFAGHIDPARIGGFGASLGGESLLLMGGAQLTTTVGQAYKQVEFDPRLKAAATYVPYFGQVVFPAFGRDQNGLQDVSLPLLAISGTADTTAPIAATRAGFQFLKGTRQLVALTGVEHGFDPAFSDEIFTWSLSFLDGELSGDPVARATSARMTSVAGGGEDILEIDYIAPSPELPGERVVIEFHNDALDHYFTTADPSEAAMLDAGVLVPGWQRTGFAFKGWQAGDPRGLPACRFYGSPGSHFYTINAAECALVMTYPYWVYEGIAFNMDPLAGSDCAPDRVPVVRLYNNGMRGQASHRYVTSHSETANMVQQGWVVEGAVFCAVP
jgi:predicted dienelactone hydrolase